MQVQNAEEWGRRWAESQRLRDIPEICLGSRAEVLTPSTMLLRRLSVPKSLFLFIFFFLTSGLR